MIRLPLVERRSQITGKSSPDCFDGQHSIRSRVLVVDDNLDSAQSLAKLLLMRGNEVETANDGTAALAAMESFRPSIVLLDSGMPGMSGYEVAQRVRGMLGGKEIDLVALTGWGQEEDHRRTRKAGFNHYLDLSRMHCY